MPRNTALLQQLHVPGLFPVAHSAVATTQICHNQENLHNILGWELLNGRALATWLEGLCWSGRTIFFSRVNFLYLLLFWYPLHPYITAVAHKRSWSFCQKCRKWQVTAKHTCTPHMWLWIKTVNWYCMAYTESVLRWQQFHMVPSM